MMSTTNCPVCGTELQETPTNLENKDASRYKCKRCGSYEASDFVFADTEFESRKHLVSAWIRRQNRMGERFPMVGVSKAESTDNWFVNLEKYNLPKTIIEKADALLLACAEIMNNENVGVYDETLKTELHPSLISYVAAKHVEEIRGLCKILEDLGYIKVGDHPYHISIKGKGWMRIAELREKGEVFDSAFIAMWFDTITEKYREATINAVQHCGYQPYVVDQEEFNGFIMDQVISLIRQSRFIVADFTSRPEEDNAPHIIGGVRGGVYWEAGMGYGLGIPVIHTCEDSEGARKRIHFDIDQYNTIFWDEGSLSNTIRENTDQIPDPNYGERLAVRILSSIGRGSYSPDT